MHSQSFSPGGTLSVCVLHSLYQALRRWYTSEKLCPLAYTGRPLSALVLLVLLLVMLLVLLGAMPRSFSMSAHSRSM